MTKGVSNIFTYHQFEQHIEQLIEAAKRTHYLELATNANIDDQTTSAYIALLASVFPENTENYFLNFYDFWDDWGEVVECAIVSFVYGVVDYSGKGNVVAPCNHSLLHLSSMSDPVNVNSETYTVNKIGRAHV